jgi:hypothetical protein
VDGPGFVLQRSDQDGLLAEAAARDVQRRYSVGDQIGDDPVAGLGDDDVAGRQQVDVPICELRQQEQIAPTSDRPAVRGGRGVAGGRRGDEGVPTKIGQAGRVRTVAGVAAEAEEDQRRIERQSEATARLGALGGGATGDQRDVFDDRERRQTIVERQTQQQ